MAGFRCPNCSAAQTVEAVERAAGRVVCRSCGASTSLEVSNPFGSDEHIDLPAPKSAFMDLPAPKGMPAGPPAAPSFTEETDLPAPVFRGKSRGIDNVPPTRPAVRPPPRPAPPPMPNLAHENLPAPKRPQLPDLLAPVAQPSSPPPLPNLPDNLPVPKGRNEPSNLPAPKGFFDDVAPSGAPDNLPAPKGFFDDALAPKNAPLGGRAVGGDNLPAPKGFFEDGVAPKGDGAGAVGGPANLPAPKGFFDDAVAPKGDPRGPGPGNLPAPKGFFDDAVSPRSPHREAGHANLPAPKGIFDDLAPPAAMAGVPASGLDLGEPFDLGAPLGEAPIDLGAPLGAPPDPGSLNLDSLELGGQAPSNAPPAERGSTGRANPPPLDLGAPQRPFGLDDLELEAPSSQPGDSAFGGVSLPGGGPAAVPQEPMAPPANDGVVSFSKPSDSAMAAGQQGFVRRRPADEVGPLELDDAPLPAEQQQLARKTLAKERRSGVSVAPPSRTGAKRRTKILAAVVGVLALGAGGFYAFNYYTEGKAKGEAVKAGVAEARKHLIADRAGHWDAAVKSAKKAIVADKGNAEAQALAAQAHLASSIDTGINRQAKIAQAKKLTAGLRQAAAKGPEVEKAEGLQALAEGRGTEALQKFRMARQANPRDSSLDLYDGWANLSINNFVAAEKAFRGALKSSPDRVAALYGLGRALQGLGKIDDARASYLKTIEKSRERYKTDHVAALVGAAELAEVERFTDRENRYLEILGRGDLSKADPRAIARAWTLAGDEALRAGRLQEANQRYTKALELDGSNRAAVVGEGKTLLALRRFPEARERLSRVLNVDPADLDASLALAEVALGEEELTEAKQLIAKILEADPPIEDKVMLSGAHRVLAGALALEPDSDANAESEYREAIRLAGDEDIRAVLDLANFFVIRNRGDEAKAVLEPIRDRAKKDPAIGVRLGVAYLGANDPVAAEQTLRGALELRPGDAEARFQLGISLLAQKRSDEGLAAIKAAYESNKAREDIGLALAVAYEENTRFKDAASLYESLLANEAPSLNVKARAGRYFARHGAGARAISLGEEILAESKDNPAGLFLLGEKHYAANEFDKAQRAYLDAASLDKQAQYLEGAGRAAEKQRNFDDSLRHFESTLALEPNYLAALLGQARIYLGRRSFRQAIKALERAISLEPSNGWSHFARGVALVELGELKKGVDPLKRAVKLEPNLAEAHYRLGRAYFDLDKAKAAASSLDRATDTANGDEPWVTEAYRVLGYAHRMARNRRAAIKAFRAYLDRNPEKGPQRADAKRELLFLEGGGR